MNDKGYIAVKDYATAKGISIQAVYKQMKKKLKPYVIYIEGKKYLKIEALNHSTEELNEYSTNSTELNQNSTVLNEHSTELNQPFQPELNTIKPDFQPLLESQIAEKDKQIESLLRQIEELQSQNKKLTEQHDEFIKLISQSQYITATEQQRLIEKPKEKKGIFGIFRKNK